MQKSNALMVSLVCGLSLSGCSLLNSTAQPKETIMPVAKSQVSLSVVNSVDLDSDVEKVHTLSPMPFDQLVQQAKDDSVAAFNQYRDFAEKGHIDSQYLLGLAYINGTGTAIDTQKGLKWLTKAASGDYTPALLYLGNFYAGARDFSESKRWLMLASHQQQDEAIFRIAQILEIEQNNCLELTPDEMQELVDGLHQFLGKSGGMAEYHIGMINLLGINGEPNVEKGLIFLNKAADQGNNTALLELGQIYTTGIEVEGDSTIAFEYFHRAANNDSPAGQYTTGMCYVIGAGVEQDISKGMQILKAAADQHYPPAETLIGKSYLYGLNAPKDPELAYRYLKAATDHNHPEGIFLLGTMYDKGMAVTQDFETAQRLIVQADDLGCSHASVYLGRALTNGTMGYPIDHEKAFAYFLKGTNNSDNEAELEVGRSYELGRGVSADSKKAIEWYRRSAENGNPNAKFFLSICFTNGIGTEAMPEKGQALLEDAVQSGSGHACSYLGHFFKDEFLKFKKQDDADSAFKFATYAANLGNAEGQYLLGFLYASGIGTSVDNKLAIKWLKESSDQGYLLAEFVLADLYRTGKGISKDMGKAMNLYIDSAQRGCSSSQERLGELYLSGIEIPKNMEKAVYWLTLASQQQSGKAEHNLAILYRTGNGVQKDLRKAITLAKEACQHGEPTACNLIKHLNDELGLKGETVLEH